MHLSSKLHDGEQLQSLYLAGEEKMLTLEAVMKRPTVPDPNTQYSIVASARPRARACTSPAVVTHGGMCRRSTRVWNGGKLMARALSRTLLFKTNCTWFTKTRA